MTNKEVKMVETKLWALLFLLIIIVSLMIFFQIENNQESFTFSRGNSNIVLQDDDSLLSLEYVENMDEGSKIYFQIYENNSFKINPDYFNASFCGELVCYNFLGFDNLKPVNTPTIINNTENDVGYFGTYIITQSGKDVSLTNEIIDGVPVCKYTWDDGNIKFIEGVCK